MNALTEKYPDSIMYDGEKIPINTDFRVWIDFTQIAISKGTDDNAAVEIFSRIFNGYIPENFELLFPALLDFYNPQFLQDGSGKTKVKNGNNRIIDFEKDAGLIFAAFMSEYGIDLSSISLHWWSFKALFGALPESTKIVQVMQYRSMTMSDINKIKDNDRRKFYRKMHRIYALDGNDTPQEKEDAMIMAFSSFF